MSEKRYYDADYVIRMNNEYEEQRIYNSPVEVKLRKMIEEATEKCNLQNDKLKAQREKLNAKRLQRLAERGRARANASSTSEADEISFGM